MDTSKPVHSLVLDATPLITQSASALQQFASKFYTTPGVHAELKDEHARNQLILWADRLTVRQPKPVYVEKVSAFAKLTGDYSVLSMNDVHIIALAYELNVEQSGDKNLRKFPGEKLEGDVVREYKPRRHYEEEEEVEVEDDDGFQVVTHKKKPRKPRYKHYQKTEVSVPEPKVELAAELEKLTVTEEPVEEVSTENAEVSEELTQGETTPEEDAAASALLEEYNDDDDDGDWITPDNIQEELLKDNNETVKDALDEVTIPVALSTGDFACQNVTMQIGLNLMNPVSGKQIKRVRNYMYRCHACFNMIPMHKSGQAKHFCPRCGGNTLLRCAVSVDNFTGKVTPHLKANFQWIKRGHVFSVASPLSKNTQKLQGNRGYQHNKENRHKTLQDPLILREDQKEYAQAIKDDAWHRKKSEKMLQEFIGGGSADNFISPFGTNHRGSGVRVGRGRQANAVKSRRK